MKIDSMATAEEFIYFFASFRSSLAATYFALKDAQKAVPRPYFFGNYLYDLVAAWNLTHPEQLLTLGYMMTATERIANEGAVYERLDAPCYR
ncbi:hypothetical protein [Nitrososphaera viennensis]|nr:hypothetical protein [Nitrososphaera viennensis]UVS69062.1 hypothetical protein NWT39_14290 [Nitrososphaera viennensis]